MKKSILLVLMLLGLAHTGAWAQQDPVFTQFMYNQLFFNPGYAGMDGNLRAHLVYRQQYFGNYSATGAGSIGSNSQLLGINAPLLRIKSGVGLFVMRDQIGANVGTQAHLNYAYHMPLGAGRLSLGARGSFFNQSLDYSKLVANQPEDPVLTTGTLSDYGFDAGVGAWYKAEKYFVGLAGNNLLGAKIDMGRPSIDNARDRMVYLNAGYIFDAGYTWTITPQVLGRMANFNQFQFEGAVIANHLNQFFGGASFRQDDAVAAIVGLGLLKNQALRFSYAIDVVAINKDNKGPFSHEVVLSYNLPMELRGAKPIIRSPRYRK